MYTGECGVENGTALDGAVPEVEVLVQDFFQLEEVQIEDVLSTVKFGREGTNESETVWYTLECIMRGYLCGISDEQAECWAPDVTSMVHERTYSQTLSDSRWDSIWADYAAALRRLEEDETSVSCKQYCRRGGDVIVQRIWEREEKPVGFQDCLIRRFEATLSLKGVRAVTPPSGSKRKQEDCSTPCGKRSRTDSVV